jgi:hypothetical protein
MKGITRKIYLTATLILNVLFHMLHIHIFTDKRQVIGGTRWCRWLRHYTTSRKVACSSPDDITECFQFIYSFQPHRDHGVYPASNKNEYQIFLGVKRCRLSRLTTFLQLSTDCLENVGSSTFTTLYASTACFRDSFTPPPQQDRTFARARARTHTHTHMYTYCIQNALESV